MISPKASVRILAIIAVTATAGLAGCDKSDKPATTASRSFPLSGNELKIEASETTLHIKNGSGDEVEVEQKLKGDASDDGNSTLSMSGNTLKLAVKCQGVVLDCSGEHTISVPKGTALRLNASGSPVDLKSYAGDIVATVDNDGSLRVTKPSGSLQLRCSGGNITVADATSAVVVARTSADGNIKLDFAAAPRQVEASASGSVDITVPASTESYRVVGASSGNVRSDAKSDRTITVSAADGSARVSRAD